MTMRCPYCLSYQVDTLNQAKKTGSAVGTVAGAASGASSSFTGARVGASISAVVGPLGSVVGGCAGALLGGPRDVLIQTNFSTFPRTRPVFH